jgi:hypothetical protein
MRVRFVTRARLKSVPENEVERVRGSMAAQTETQRKAAAQKGAATRKRNEAKRRQAARKAAATRARAQASRLKAAGYEAQRALDTSVGAAVVAGEGLRDAARTVTDSQERRRATAGVRKAVRDAERRGSRVRKGAQRTVTREAKRARKTVETRARRGRATAEKEASALRRDAEGSFERGVDEARSGADEALRRASNGVGELKEHVRPD